MAQRGIVSTHCPERAVVDGRVHGIRNRARRKEIRAVSENGIWPGVRQAAFRIYRISTEHNGARCAALRRGALTAAGAPPLE